MSDTVIKVQNLSKRYVIGHQGNRHDGLRHQLDAALRSPLRWLRERKKNKAAEQEDFWALKDVSFDIKEGEVVGIIGRNGAGKSTLLKVLSRITEPTSGTIKIRGRVASLLEVGTGFHPELTGRENVFLNGAILGMSKAEIKSKFDEIVAFAEIEKFLDTPVKRYSSGMYVRLAFAVAAHLEPEILIVDEVLAVGDAQFQQKCLGKMQKVSSSGRTVLFVSHNLASVRALCTKAIYLQKGTVQGVGAVEEILEHYVGLVSDESVVTFKANPEKPSITRVEVEAAALAQGDIVLNIDFVSPFALRPPIPGMVLYTSLRVPVFGSNPRFDGCDFSTHSMKEGRLRIVMEKPPLRPGRYLIAAWLGDWQNDYDHKQDVIAFEFGEDDKETHQPPVDVIGPLASPARWTAAELAIK